MNMQPAVNEALKDVEYFTNRFGKFHCQLYVNTKFPSPIQKSVVLEVSSRKGEQWILTRYYYMNEAGEVYTTDRRRP